MIGGGLFSLRVFTKGSLGVLGKNDNLKTNNAHCATGGLVSFQLEANGTEPLASCTTSRGPAGNKDKWDFQRQRYQHQTTWHKCHLAVTPEPHRPGIKLGAEILGHTSTPSIKLTYWLMQGKITGTKKGTNKTCKLVRLLPQLLQIRVNKNNQPQKMNVLRLPAPRTPPGRART